MSTYDVDGAPYDEGQWAGTDAVTDPCVDAGAEDDIALGTEVLADAPAEPLFEEPVYDEPVYDEPAYEEPAYEEPAYEAVGAESALDAPVYQEPELAPAQVDTLEPDTGGVVEPAAAAWESTEMPALYEEGTLVSQEPVADDLVTVEAIAQSEVYQEWEAVTGGLDLGAAGGAIPATGTFAAPGMIGDAGDVNFWFEQNSQFSCGPSSVAQILSDFTGVVHADESLVAARAQQLGWYDPSTGMLPENVANLLDDQGVPSTEHRDQTFDHVEQYLREGRAVVMFLDSRDVMPATGYEDYVAADQLENSAQDTVDHFVRVIGIDQAAGVAIISNPGYAGASQVEIPLAQLDEAWNDNVIRSDTQIDRGRILIVSDAGDPTPDDAATPQVPGEVTPQPTPQQPLPQPEPVPTNGADPTSLPPVDPQPTPVGTGATPDPQVPGSPQTPGTPEPASAPPAFEGPRQRPEVELPAAEGRRFSSPERPRIVELPTDGPSFSVPATSAPVPTEVTLPADPAEVDAPASAQPAADADEAPLFSSVPGWVLIPVTLAAGRIGAALLNKK